MESELKDELIHSGFQKTPPLSTKKSSLPSSPGFKLGKVQPGLYPPLFYLSKIGNYSVSCIRPGRKLTNDSEAKKFLACILKALGEGSRPDLR